MIYLDYAANTPVDKRVLAKFDEVTLSCYGNANSLHDSGIYAKNLIDKASREISSYFNCEPSCVIYTSGSSEANNFIIKGVASRHLKNKGHIIISSNSHSSVIAPCNYLATLGYEVDVIPLNKNGVIDLEKLENTIQDNTILVSITAVDGEIGAIQPINDISKLLKKDKNILFHVDATQAIGKVSLDYTGVDFLTFAPHKFYGLNGIGAAINFNSTKLTPLIHGGKSTTIYRSGTPPTASIVAFATALKIALKNQKKRYNYVLSLNKYLISELKNIPNIKINIPTSSVANIINFSVKNANVVVKKLYKQGIYVSRKSACSNTNSPSNSVLAITNDISRATNSIRISISYLTTKKELIEFIKILRSVTNENN